MKERSSHERVTPEDGQRIGVIGSGIAGLTAAYLLSKKHQVILYESNSYLGGQTYTEQVNIGDKVYPVSCSFGAYNDWVHPNLKKLMQVLNVESEATDMSFSVHCGKTGLAYSTKSLNTIFAQRKNLFRPSFISMMLEVLRFNKDTTAALEKDQLKDNQSLADYLVENEYMPEFITQYIIPMGAAIWPACSQSMFNFPIKYCIHFFENYGMLGLKHRPQWHRLKNGSESYIDAISESFKDKIRLNSPIESVIRYAKKVQVCTLAGQKEQFDYLIFACPNDHALKMLEDPSYEETRILNSIPYQTHEAVLHTDKQIMPSTTLAWASWNYHIPETSDGLEHLSEQTPMVTYHLNRLHDIQNTKDDLFLTLNRNHHIDSKKIINTYQFRYPLFTSTGRMAQKKFREISGHNRTYYCGAYWYNGSHEDGVNSAIRVARRFGIFF